MVIAENRLEPNPAIPTIPKPLFANPAQESNTTARGYQIIADQSSNGGSGGLEGGEVGSDDEEMSEDDLFESDGEGGQILRGSQQGGILEDESGEEEEPGDEGEEGRLDREDEAWRQAAAQGEQHSRCKILSAL